MLLTWIADLPYATPPRPAPTTVLCNSQPIMCAQKASTSSDGSFAWVFKFDPSLDLSGQDLAQLLRSGFEIFSYYDDLS